MRCLLVSDLHYSLRQYDWVLNVASHYDLVVIAGDHLDIASTVELQAQIAVILTYLKRIGARTKLIVCSGNHDLDAHNFADEKYAKWIGKARRFGIPTDADSLQLEETRFTICPWWDGPASCKAVAELLEREEAEPKKNWIWVYHAPPDLSPTSWGGKNYFGDEQLLQWIQQYSPQMVLTGHIHQSPFKEGGSWVDKIAETWVFNAGRQIGVIPAHIIFDTLQEKALWFSSEGAELVELKGNLQRPLVSLDALPEWLA